MKKKVLFVINNMKIGGIQKSLIELLKCLQDRYIVSLYCVLPVGDLLKDIPSRITMIPANEKLISTELSLTEAKSKGYNLFLQKICGSIWCKVFSKKIPSKIITNCIKIPGEYDVAISFSQPTNSKMFYNFTNEITLYSCKAKKRYTFLHCDFANYGGNDKVNRSLYRKFDGIIAVSESVGKVFSQMMPDMRNKVKIVYNCCDSKNIIKMANDHPVSYNEKITIVTVARISKEKGLLRCIDIIHDLIQLGLDIKWHIIGGGEEETIIQQLIENKKLKNKIILHGETDNPYRYIKHANLFFLPSLHEAAPMVYNEAAVLGIPILTTRTTSAEELVGANGYGWVCDNNVPAIKKALFDICVRIRDGESIKIVPIDYNIKAVTAFDNIVNYQ